MVITMGHPKAKKILWHDGFASNIKKVMTEPAFDKYANSIINYATKYKYNTVSISAIPQSVGEGEDATNSLSLGWLPDDTIAYKFINKFIAAAEAVGLSVGLNIAQKNPVNGTPPGDPSPKNPGHTDSIADLAKDISENIEHTRPLTIGIDHETNNLTANGPRSYDAYKNEWEKELQANNVAYDDFIIFGELKQPSGWNASSNFKNAYEYYSWDTKDWRTVASVFNDKISGTGKYKKTGNYKNDPEGALAYIQRNITAGNIDGPITNKTYNGQVPVFSIGTGNGMNTLGQHANKKAIGPAVFGTWEPEPFNQFISAWNEAYPDTTDIITYHGDQLPNTWYENL